MKAEFKERAEREFRLELAKVQLDSQGRRGEEPKREEVAAGSATAARVQKQEPPLEG
jgi:hypothetical protein